MKQTVAFARPLREVRRLYQSLWEVAYEHLILICAWPQHQDVPHWKHEVKAVVTRLHRLKIRRTHRPPSIDMILEWLDEYFPADPQNVELVMDLKQEEKDLPEPRPLTAVVRCVDEKQQALIDFLARKRETLKPW